jgi:DNA-binding MarR family transcriptional regulator
MAARATARRKPKVRELYFFRESAFYWFGHLEDHFNRLLLRAMRPERLTVARWRCLAVLAEEDGISLGELAAQTVIERPALTHVIDQMENDGLVLRRSEEADRRVIKVDLTDEGRALFERVLPKARSVYALALGSVPAKDYDLTLSVLKRMAANLKE